MNFGLTTILLITSLFLPPPPHPALCSPLLSSALGQHQAAFFAKCEALKNHILLNQVGKKNTSRNTALTFLVRQYDAEDSTGSQSLDLSL